MFNFVCKTLFLHLSRRCSTSTTSRVLFIRCNSTITTAPSTQKSFTVSYLINSCGFSPKSALSASKFVYFDSPEKPDSVISWFRTHGFSEQQIWQLLKGHPLLLNTSPEKTLSPKLEYFRSIGFSCADFVKFSSAIPKILVRSLEKHIIPNFNCLTALVESSNNALTLLKMKPQILYHDAASILVPPIKVLRCTGVPERYVLLFLRMWNYRNRNLEYFKAVTYEVKKMGFNPSKYKFIFAIVAKLYGKTHWESRVKIFRSWGWSEEQVLASFLKRPLTMTTSKDKIMAVMDFFVNDVKLESLVVAQHPVLISSSLEKRLIPRAAVFKLLLSKGLISGKNINLVSLFKLSEAAFSQKILNTLDEGYEILKHYQEVKLMKKCEKNLYQL